MQSALQTALFIDFYYFKSLDCEVIKREIAAILTLGWQPTDSEMSQAIEPVSRKDCFYGKIISEFLLHALKYFAGSLLYLFNILPRKDFLNVSDPHTNGVYIFNFFLFT